MLAEQYKQIGKGYGPQREFRLKWAQQEVDRLRETRIHREVSKQSYGMFGDRVGILSLTPSLGLL
eukprot:9154292-Alexandrium_andersonii.AAC.1